MTGESERIKPAQIIAISICFVIQMLDGMDVLVVAYAASQITTEWGIPGKVYGGIFAAGVFGMTVGSFLLAPFADIVGRRKTILVAIAGIAAAVVLSAFATDVTQMVVLRFVAGLGVGAAGPTLSTIAAEYSPPKYRDFVVLIIGAGYAVGAVCTGVVAAWIIPEYGWRTMFMAAGLATAIMLPLAYLLLPESLEFLLKRRPPGALEHANRILPRLGRPLLSELPKVAVEQRSGLGVSNLLAPIRRTSTLSCWIAFFMVYATVYLLLGWVPKLVGETGFALKQAIWAGTIYNFGGFAGIIFLGALGTRLPLLRALLAFQVASTVLMICFGILTPPLAGLLLIIGSLGFFSQAGLVGMVAVAARLYPTELRATGIGWGMGAGRFGAFLGPYIAGVLLDLFSRATILMLFSAPFILCGIAILFIRFPTRTSPIGATAD